MSMAATDLKGLLTISVKSRHDGYSDQYNRIFMVKFLLVCTLVMGISWYQDSINCIVPDAHEIDAKFVSSTCWIQGVYVYKELRERIDEVAYFGMPIDMDQEGYLSNTIEKELCVLNPKSGKKSNYCVPLSKTFFLQYQYMPFLIAALSILFYLPYIFFRSANSDLISLKNTVKGDDPDAEKIAKHYFDRKTNPQRNNMLRVIFNILIKILYIVANLVALLGLNNIMNGEYLSYGSQWVSWAQLDNSVAYDYMGMRDHPKPGNLLLPPFGYCEVHASAKDIKNSYGNQHKFVCELSQNILYQYCLIVLWFAIIFGIVVSCLGLVILLVHYAIGIFGFKAHGPVGKKIFKMLSFRELEYLEFIRKRNIALYGEVLDKLKEFKLGPNAPDDEFPARGRDDIPLYPSLPPKDRYDDKRPGYQL